MARPASLILGLLAALVLLAHGWGLDWLARQRTTFTPLQAMPAPMYTRLLQPALPAPVVLAAPPAPPVAKRPRAQAVLRSAPEPAAPPPAEPALPETVAAVAPEVTAAPTQDEAPITTVPPSDAPAVDPLASWPSDTRLSYRLGGQYRSGPLFGDAQVQWQREGARYQVRLDIAIKYFATVRMTSQGGLSDGGLVPAAYEEIIGGQRRGARFGEHWVALDNGRQLPRHPGLQDTASQFVELTHRFATGRDTLEVGRAVSFWMARPAGVDHWTYDVVGRELLETELGPVEAFHLKPRPIANPRGNITAEMWFAPGLQHLPVRIKVLVGEEAFLDLLVERIEQR